MAVIEHEANRQVEVLEGGGAIVQETRLFDPDRNETRSLRSKEEAHDYRYFPDPDLLPVELSDAFLSECRASLPELPDAKRARYEQALGLSAYNAAVLTADVDTARWFEALLAATGRSGAEVGKAASNWLISDLFGALNRLGRGIEDSPVTPAQGAELLGLGRRRHAVGHARQAGVRDHARNRRGSRARSSRSAASSRPATPARSRRRSPRCWPPTPTRSREYRGGKDKLFGFFVGQTMKAMAGKANPQVVNELLKKALG